jgi:hypothetical protein
VLAGREAQPDCVGALWLQTEATGTVVTWFYQAASAIALLSFAVAWIAPFYVAWGATTRDSNVIIPVETVTPPCQRTIFTMGGERCWVNLLEGVGFRVGGIGEILRQMPRSGR